MTTVDAARAELPAGLDRVSCLVLTCVECGDQYGDETGPYHFPGPRSAYEAIEEAEWLVTATGLACKQCLLKRICRRWRHAFEPCWICEHHGSHGQLCTTCGKHEALNGSAETGDHGWVEEGSAR